MIEVTDLSGDIELESFRVSGLGAARLLVATCYSDDHPDIPSSDPIRDLQSQLRELTDEREALETEIAILKGFGKNMANMPGLTPDNATSFSSTLFEKTLSNATAVRELDAKITEFDRQIEKLEDAKSGTADVRAVVTIVADDAGPAQLRLTYREFSIQTPPGYRINLFPPRCGRGLMASTLRLVCLFTRWEAVHFRLFTLSGEPLPEHGGGLE